MEMSNEQVLVLKDIRGRWMDLEYTYKKNISKMSEKVFTYELEQKKNKAKDIVVELTNLHEFECS